jgi:hypothetical protein
MEEALDHTVWRTGFGRGFGPVVRQTDIWINIRKDEEEDVGSYWMNLRKVEDAHI